jgi:pimeloyl-ACP methyl ester carboxylesterase
MGERVHLLSRDVGLSVHVGDLEQFLEDEDLRDVTLVGHSYGGMVITGAASRTIERIRRLVYFDAPVPRHGDSLFDCLPALAGLFRASAVDGWRLDPPDPSWWGVTDAADRAWVSKHVTAVSLATCEERVDAPGNPTERIPRVYLRCTGSSLPESIADALRSQPGWEVMDIDAGHDAMITDPDAVVTALRACCS